MLIVYASKTGNVQRFVQKLPLERNLKISSGEESINEPCVLLTYTTGLGDIPEEVKRFVSQNQAFIKGIAASGNRNWGTSFGKAAITLNQQYGFPILHTFEMSGQRKDIAVFMEGVNTLVAN